MSDLISRSALYEKMTEEYKKHYAGTGTGYDFTVAMNMVQQQPTIEAVPVVKSQWRLEAHNEKVNYRWNVTAECPECGFSKGEIWGGFFPGVPNSLADAVAIDCAERVKISNFCPNCGCCMKG